MCLCMCVSMCARRVCRGPRGKEMWVCVRKIGVLFVCMYVCMYVYIHIYMYI
jgi:hypothetical protein